MTEFVTIATFNFVHEISVLKSILDRENIPYLFQNENLVSIDPMASLAYGGIQLKIHPNDILAVQTILDDLNNNLKIV
ncbi:DUF2007 domain-containing protein [Flavobacterium sp. J49]|uniref:DUF2007 domain-containing protein n=1 Tax=Flavobacterium sp. J49 TaxID=2718534 RepID=UPI001594D19F|nr:DUF2007 domain-containing protein [Flavobacterium sp. J49]MBF6641444.1 DUF2007 domain-containing protein [Flavobacterium sp. J49]NIC02691.1 DUF2007 domain-containing protein [Flavobacterium sp. J49]